MCTCKKRVGDLWISNASEVGVPMVYRCPIHMVMEKKRQVGFA